MPAKDYKQVSNKELRKLKGEGFCALCQVCGGCTEGHIHCRKCVCAIDAAEGGNHD